MGRTRRRAFAAMRFGRLAAAILLASLPCAAPGAEPVFPGRPSFLLLVIDTLRADAVSAYGSVKGTTPRLDALAREGLLYRNAHAPSPWTLPSHATLFTGQGVDRHRTGMPGQAKLPTGPPTLAEIQTKAGYQTAAISGNALVSDRFQMLRGFEYRRSEELLPQQGPGLARAFDPLTEVRRWLQDRDPTRPYLLFVNLIEAHAPYEIRDENPFLPEGADPAAVRRRSKRPQHLLCGGLPSTEGIAIQRALYLGDVAAADQTAGAIVDLLRAEGTAEELIIVVTSDHGELFGEDRLMGHEFSLHGALLQVPLIVHGLDAPPAVIEQGVRLADVAPSILRWAGGAAPPALQGRPLPESNDASAPERTFFAAYSDRILEPPKRPRGAEGQQPHSRRVRQFCRSSDPVFGSMASITRHPYKFRWYEQYPPKLYDLRWDPQELSDQSAYQTERVKAFTAEIEAFVEEAGLTNAAGPEPDDFLSPPAADALRQLGYIE